jgi:ECF transporter S component (folate family)
MFKKKILLQSSHFIARVALLTAICVVTNTLDLTLGGNSQRISFIYVPCFMAGIMLGPLGGALVGFLGDFLGALIFPKGAYMILIGVASMLTGVIPGIVFKFKGGNTTFKLILSFLLCLVVCTAGLNTYAVWSAFIKSMGFFQYLLTRLPIQVINLFINCIIMLALYKVRYFAAMFGEKPKSTQSAAPQHSAAQAVAQPLAADRAQQPQPARASFASQNALFVDKADTSEV